MKKIKSSIIIIGIVSGILHVFLWGNSDSVKFTDYHGHYFGQKRPGIIPEVFAPDLLKNSINTVFLPDGSEFFFVRDYDNNNSGDILWMRRINGQWTVPVPAPFNSIATDNDICVNPNGKYVYFRSWRKINNISLKESRSCIWFSERSKNGWKAPKPLIINGVVLRAGYPSVANSGNLYFPKKTTRNNLGELYMMSWQNGHFTSPRPLMNDLKNQYDEGDMCVDPDERFVITACWKRPNSDGSESDLYIAFRNDNQQWTRLFPMGNKINTAMIENCPTISPDGKFFFFMRYNRKKNTSNAYWVDTKIIELLRIKYLEEDQK